MHPRFRASLSLAALGGLLVFAAPLGAADGDALRAVLAQLAPAAGWTAPEPVRTAAGDDLFDLIDGGAELYHEYGFVRAATWQIANAAHASIQVELYEMKDAAAAYGVFSLMQSGTFTRGALGQGSLRFGYYVAFWGGAYFASVTGAQPDAATQAEVDRLGAQLAALLPRTGELPAWFARLPAAELQERKYFRGRIGLSNIPLGEIAELLDSKEGLVAIYPGCKLLLLPFATAAQATAQLDRVAQAATARASLSGVKSEAAALACTDADGNRIVVRTHGEDLLVFIYTEESAYRKVAGQLD